MKHSVLAIFLISSFGFAQVCPPAPQPPAPSINNCVTFSPPYVPGQVLDLPCSFPEHIALEKLVPGTPVKWQGLAGDTVFFTPGTEFRPLEGPTDFIYTVRADGYLDYRLEPRK